MQLEAQLEVQHKDVLGLVLQLLPLGLGLLLLLGLLVEALTRLSGWVGLSWVGLGWVAHLPLGWHTCLLGGTLASLVAHLPLDTDGTLASWGARLPLDADVTLAS